MSTAEFWSAERISSDYGDPRPQGRVHRGTDWSHSTQSGTPIPSPVAGRVISKLSPASWHGFGYQITIDTGSGTFSFAHLHKASPLHLKQRVRVGDILGHEGTTGSATGPCVHVEFYRTQFRDPAPVIASLMAAPAAVTVKPLPPSPAPPREEEEMKIAHSHWTEGGKLMRIMFVPGTSWYLEWTEAGADIANGYARQLDTGNSVEITASMAGAIKDAAAR